MSAGPKKRPMPEGGEIVPRDFVVPPPPPKPKIPGPDEAPRPSTQVPPPPVLPGPVMRPKPVAAPPPPPVGRPAAAGRRRRRELGRQALFWFLVLGSWSLFFAAGALGTAVRDPHSFLESLTRPFTYADGNLLTRIGATVLALVLLALAFFQNRRAIEDSYLPGPAIMLLIFAGLAIYAGALGLPVPEGTDGTVSRVLRGLRETWLHGVHLCPAAVWAVLTGFALGSHPAASRREFAAGGIHLAAGLAAAALFGALGSGGSIESLGRNLAQPLGAGVPALVALACAGLAVALAFGRRRPRPVRVVGVLLGLAAASGALLTGVRPPDGPPSLGALLQAPFAGFGADFLAHGGLLTAGVLVGLWGAGVLYNRFIP